MTALDTNVLVRFVVNDDPDQVARAKRLIAAGDLHLAKTILLEAEWVLRRHYRLERDRLRAVLRGIVGLPGLAIEDAAVVAAPSTGITKASTSPTRSISPRRRRAAPSRHSTGRSPSGLPASPRHRPFASHRRR